MVRKLNEKDRESVLEYVGKQPSINLFIIGDIENFGFDTEFQEVWGKFDNSSNLKAILLRYRNNFIPYYEDINEDLSDFKEIILSYSSPRVISGKSDLLENFKEILENFKEKNTYFCELNNGNCLKYLSENVKVAKEEDAQRVFDLIATIEEFSDTLNSKYLIKSKIENKSGRIYYIENNQGEIVSVAQTTAENSKSAMVVGVATKVGYREKGYMTQCLSKLCDDLLQQGKILCLFYDNPKAGKVYHKLGFKEIGEWNMLIESQK